jgi:hypothetical protein
LAIQKQKEARLAELAKAKQEEDRLKAEEDRKARQVELEEKRRVREENDRKRKEREEKNAAAAREKALKQEAEKIAAKAKVSHSRPIGDHHADLTGRGREQEAKAGAGCA